MGISYKTFSLQFKYPFAISSVSRTETKVVFIEITDNKFTGYGEASLPPYLSETQETVIDFIKKVNADDLINQEKLSAMIHYVNTLAEGNYAAKAAFDIALHDYYGKKTNKPVYKLLGLNKNSLPPALYTIGISKNLKELENKINEAVGFTILKLKTDNNKPLQQVRNVRKFTDKPLCIDVNQGWSNKEEALDIINNFKDEGVLFVEQPFNKNNLQSLEWLYKRSPIPVFADESFQTLEDIDKLKNVCHGVNIKLMKCGGLEQARLIIKKAKENKLKVILGCMSESSCGVAAASHLTPLVDYADLDGPLLIKNDPFNGVEYYEGIINISDEPGTGAKKIT